MRKAVLTIALFIFGLVLGSALISILIQGQTWKARASLDLDVIEEKR